MSIYPTLQETHIYIEELKIWVTKTADGILSRYDKSMITRKRNQMIKSNPADIAKIDAAIAAATQPKIDAAAVKTAAESVVYMMTESGQMVPIK
jgi:hypothetical protein